MQRHLLRAPTSTMTQQAGVCRNSRYTSDLLPLVQQPLEPSLAFVSLQKPLLLQLFEFVALRKCHLLKLALLTPQQQADLVAFMLRRPWQPLLLLLSVWRVVQLLPQPSLPSTFPLVLSSCDNRRKCLHILLGLRHCDPSSRRAHPWF